MSTKANEDKKSLARILYMSGEQQNIIAEKVGATKQTINKWVADGEWSKRRAAQSVTRPELVNKLLRAIDKVLEKALENEDNSDTFDGLGDKLAKFAVAIEKLDKKANVVDAIEVFMAFGKWLYNRSQTDKELSLEIAKIINKYQDIYVSEQLNDDVNGSY